MTDPHTLNRAKRLILTVTCDRAIADHLKVDVSLIRELRRGM